MNSRFFGYLLYIVLSSMVLLEQILDPYWAGFELVVSRHNDMLAGQAYFYNPWQYRILSTYLLEGFIQLLDFMGVTSLIPTKSIPQLNLILPQHLPFLLFKWGILYLLFWSADTFYRQIGLTHIYNRIISLWLLSFVMYPVQFSADLSLDIYLEVIFYLWGGYFILRQNYWSIIPVVIVATLNRESSGFIPLMLGTYLLASSSFNFTSVRQGYILPYFIKLTPVWISLGAYVIIFIALRYYYGYPLPRTVYGNESVLDFFTWNFSQPTTYIQLLRTFTLFPFLIIYTFRQWPFPLKLWGWLILPAWIIIHSGYSVMRETRLFLVPISLLIIPGVCHVLINKKREAIKK